MELNLFTLMDKFETDDECRLVLEELRWPEGVTCPRCGSEKYQQDSKRHTYDCTGCGYQFSVTAGTIFHDSHLPLRKWFVATYLICEAKKGVSANQLKRTIGVSYKTAWYLCHRIRAAMAVASPVMLSGTVEMDETFIGGKPRRGTGRRDQWGGIPGPDPARPKTVVLGALERGGDLRLRVSKNRGGAAIKSFATDTLADHVAAIYSDDWSAYRSLADADTQHESVNHSQNEWVRGDVHTNGIESAWSLFKRSIVGSYHQLSAKHLDAYLDEFEWRFNNRENVSLFTDTLRAMVSTEALAYKALTAD